MILNLGPVEIYLDGVALARNTFGGATLNIETVDKNEISNDFNQDPMVVGGTGVINFYSWPSAINITNDLEIFGWKEVILAGNNMAITLYRCRMILDTSLDVGTNAQKPLSLKLIFTANSAGNVIKIGA